MVKKKRVVRRAKKAGKPVRAKAKKATKRPKVKSKKRTVKKAAASPELNLEKIGKVTHYFPHVNAAAVKLLKSGIKIGDKIYLKGHTTDFKEDIRSMQLDHAPIQEGRKGQEIGLFVKSRVRIGDSVYRL
ncbi:MAG: hypothetical protein JXB40_04190 [Candidatus Omnitrophica bacterium]|nr:hypothetical protein [Candidatus Omnitrophota bacterium]